jgi:tetraacyldisaccharide 4'-kinase
MAAGEYSDIHDKVVSSPFAALLLPLSGLWYAGAKLRRMAFDKGWRKSQELPVPVISVGNLAMGGTGKTPLVELIARKICGQGLTPAVISRGYGGSDPGPLLVKKRGGAIEVSEAEAGDEPIMLAAHLPDAVVVVGRDRFAAADLAIKECGANVILLDDGFQHFQMERDLDIVVLDTNRPPGWPFPAGYMRESVDELGRAGLIVLNKTDTGRYVDRWLNLCLKNAKKVPIIRCKHAPLSLRRVGSTEKEGLSRLRGNRVVAAAAIADFNGFVEALKGMGAIVAAQRRFGDHHAFTRSELEHIERTAAASAADMIVITAKDETKLGGFKPHMPMYVLEIEVEVIEGADILDNAILGALSAERFLK